MEPKEKKAFEPTGLVPRSIVRTFERFRQQLLPGSETVAIREFRISRYQVLVSARCLFALLTIPIATNWLVSNWLLSPIIEHFWNTKQNEIFLNFYQEERAFAELEFFSEKLFFESLLNNSGVNEFPTLLSSPISLPKGTVSVSHVLTHRLAPSVYPSCDTFTPTLSATFALPLEDLRSWHGVEKGNQELLNCPLKNSCQVNPVKTSDYKNLKFVDNKVSMEDAHPDLGLLTPFLPPPRVRGLATSPTDIKEDLINLQNTVFSNHGKSVDSLYNEGVNLEFYNSKGIEDPATFTSSMHPLGGKRAVDFWSISNYLTPIFSEYFIESPTFPSFTTSLLPSTLEMPFDSKAIFEKERGYATDEKRIILSHLPMTDTDHSLLFLSNNPFRVPLGYNFAVQEGVEGVNKRDTSASQPQQLTEVVDMDSLKIKEKVQDKILELAVYYNQQTILSITNVVGDLVSLFTLGCLFIWMRPEITILKSFLIEAIYSLSDTTKSFLLILLTDLLVGFHSPRGWETALELLLKHFGLPENQDFVFLFVATFPVLLDTVFKYWIFRHLNKISPSTVATYHSMIE